MADDTPEGIADGTGGADGPPSIRTPMLIGGVLLLVVVLGLGFVLLRGGSQPTQLTYVIPAGTGTRIDAGEQVELIPTQLDLKVGDSMVVTNQDSRTHVVGPFSVRAGETITYNFSRPSVYKGECTVHTGGEVTITVT